MSIESQSVDASVEPADPADPPVKLDFAKYRSDEIVESLAELIGVPGRVMRIVRTAALTITLTVIACFLIRVYSELALIPSLAICAYSLVASVYFGVSLGILRVISKALQNIESILQIVLNTTDKVAQDYDQARTGQLQLPSSGELVEQVYGKVMVPALERAVARSFYFLSMPILWVYHRTIGSAVHRIVVHVNQSLSAEAAGEKPLSEQSVNPEKVESDVERVRIFTRKATETTGNLGRRLRFYAMLPMYVMYCVTLALATIPVVVSICWFG